MSLPDPARENPKTEQFSTASNSRRRQKSDQSLTQSEESVDKIIKVKGFFKGASVTVSVDNDAIVWMQARKSPASTRLRLKSTKQPTSFRIPLVDIVSIVADRFNSEEIADIADDPDSDSRLKIVARRPVDSSARGRWRLWEGTLSPVRGGVAAAKGWSTRVSLAMQNYQRVQIQQVGLLINTAASTDWSIERVLIPTLNRFGLRIEHRIDSANAKQLAALTKESASNLMSCDALIIVGGDGTVQRVCAALLEAQKSPARLPPLCPLPAGRHADIVRSLMGGPGIDFETAIAHLLVGQTRPVNCTRVLSRNRKNSSSSSHFTYHTWCFNAAYGLPTAVLTCLNQNSLFPDTKYQRALDSVIAKPDFRAVAGRLRLQLPVASDSIVTKDVLRSCSIGCPVCRAAANECIKSADWLSEPIDQVCDFDPLDSSNCSSVLSDLMSSRTRDVSTTEDTEVNGWRSVNGHFTWIGVYSISGQSGYCPDGLSPGCHANDGFLDVVAMQTKIEQSTDGREEAELKKSSRNSAYDFSRALCCTSTGESHLNLECVSFYRCRAVQFLPTDQSCNSSSSRPNQPDNDRFVHPLHDDSQRQGLPDAEDTLKRPGCHGNNRSPSQLARVLCDDEPAGSSADNKLDDGEDGSCVEDSGLHLLCSHQDNFNAVSAGPRSNSSDNGPTCEPPSELQQSKNFKKTLLRRLSVLKPAKLFRTTTGGTGGGGLRSVEAVEDEAASTLTSAPPAGNCSEVDLTRWNFDYSEVEMQDSLEWEFRCYPNVFDIFCPAENE